MKTPGGGTKYSTENLRRSTRRIRNNNKSITTKLNDSKDPENCNNTSAVKCETDTSIKDEVKKNNTSIDAKVHATVANINSSTLKTVSVDTSITNDSSWMSFSTGDLFWGQIYNYCYWPCMVCEDPDGKTINTEEVGGTGDQTVLVHFRFFADNGRRSWIKRENLMPFVGMENYQERIDEVRQKYGPKSAKFKLFVPTKKTEVVWHKAVNEANIMNEVLYADRLEKFYEILEKSKAFQKLQIQRRKSMYISVKTESNSDLESFYGSNENINRVRVPAAIKLKRERSKSYSPAYSTIKPVATKQRKLNAELGLCKAEENRNHTTDLNLSQTNAVASTSSNLNFLNDSEMFNHPEFWELYAVLKNYLMRQNHNEKLEKYVLGAVCNIWQLKQLNRRQRETDMSSTLPTFNALGSIKLLSLRLKALMARKSLMDQQSSGGTPKISMTRKPLTKETPNYLFEGMSRGNLIRCARNCNSWLHSE